MGLHGSSLNIVAPMRLGVCDSAHREGSELQPRLKGDHARTAIATQTDPQQAGWRRSGVSERSNASLRGRISWNASLRHAGKAKIRMVEDVKELTLNPQLHMLGQVKPFCQVEVTPGEIGTAQGIASEISELAILRAVAAIAGSGGHVL